jgi:hypothetical protein
VTECTQGNNGRCMSVEECYCALLDNSAPMKTLARNHVTCSVWSPLYNNRTGFYVRGPCGGYITRIIQLFPRRTPIRDLHMAFKLPYIYDYITKLCRQQAEVIQNHENAMVRNTGQGEPRHRKYKRL